MNIWEAYCNPDYYNIYFEFLKLKGVKPEEAENLKSQYCAYIQRLKRTSLKFELEKISTKEEFLFKLKDIFYEKWVGNIKYQSMPEHYLSYLNFLDTIQALYKDFINEKEKRRLIDPNFDIPILEFTQYEKEFLVGDKLVALTNPQLLYILKEYIEESGMKPEQLTLVCEEFYGDLLPNMTAEDYSKLLTMLWSSSSRKVKKGGKRNKIQITFPNGNIEEYSILDAAISVVNFYGFEEVFEFKSRMRDEYFLVKYVSYGREKIYQKIEESQYIRRDGNYKDYLQILRSIDMHFNHKLKIELC